MVPYKLRVLTVTAFLAAGFATWASSTIMMGSIANEECVFNNSCDGTLTTFSGTFVSGIDIATVTGSMVGTRLGSLVGLFDVSLWGRFDAVTKTGTILAPTYNYGADMTLVPNTFSGCVTGTYAGLFGTSAMLYNPAWEDMGFTLSGSYFCFQDLDQKLILRVTSPQLGNLIDFDGNSLSSSGTAILPMLGVTYNGVGVLSPNANNIEGLRNRISLSTGTDPFLYGTQALSVITSTITKYDFNIDIGKNLQALAAYAKPWKWTDMGGTVAMPIQTLDMGTPAGRQYYNKDVNDLPGTLGITSFDFEGTQDAVAVEGNRGKKVEIRGSLYPTAGVTAFGGSAMQQTRITGKRTFIIRGGNLFINSDLYYGNPGADMIVWVVKRDRSNPKNGGNVYVHPGVTNIVGSFIIDGAIMNFDGTNVLHANDFGQADQLRRQLLIFGSVSSANSIGGAVGPGFKCPYGTDAEKNAAPCTQDEASKYDLAFLRSFRLGTSLLTGGQPDTFDCDTNFADAREVPVATEGTDFSETQYAWAGKNQCAKTGSGSFPQANDSAGGTMLTTQKTNPTVIEFDRSVVISDLPILKKNSN